MLASVQVIPYQYPEHDEAIEEHAEEEEEDTSFSVRQ